MSVITGKRHDPYRNFQFRVKIPGFEHSGFSKVTGLREETTVSEYREGGDTATPRKMPGQTAFDNVVMERGMGPHEDFKKWRAQVYSPNGKKPSKEFRKDIVIDLLDRAGEVVKTWEVYDCWPPILEIGDLDAGSNDPLIEKMELANEGQLQTR